MAVRYPMAGIDSHGHLPVELNFITLNCWGRRHTSPFREERISAIGRYLATAEPLPHIVALQECFEHQDYLSIRQETRFTLPFGKFYSGAFSSGLVILSRWPIEESSMVPFSLSGPATGLLVSNLSVGTQGVACARIRYGEGEEDVVEIFNTYIHPGYGDFSQSSDYTIHSLSQVWELAKLVRGAAERRHLSVVLASLNVEPFSLPYRLLTSHAPIRDAWRILYPDSSLGSSYNELERIRRRPIPTAALNITENGVTHHSVCNTWAWSRSEQRALRGGERPMLVSPETPDEDGHRVDYIFFSRGGDPHAFPTDLSEILSAHNAHTDDGVGSASPPGWVVKDMRVGLTARHPDLGCSLSNHFSVEATLILHTPTSLNHRNGRRSTSSSRPVSPAQTLRDEYNMALHESNITSPQNQVPNCTSTVDVDTRTRPNVTEEQRGRPVAPRISTSTNIDMLAAAVKQGAYLQSPTASSYRRESRDRWDLQLSGLEPGLLPRLPLGAYDEIVRLAHLYASRMRRRRIFGIAHSIFWAIVLIGSYIGIWFLPTGKGGGGGAFALLVASSLGFTTGVLNLAFALLYYGAELNKLTEFEWEMRNAKAGISPDSLAHQRVEQTW